MCGLAGVVNIPMASEYIYDILSDEEHRGEDGAGIVSIKDGNFYERRRVGSLLEQFGRIDLAKELPGSTAIGQNRYATQGDYRLASNIAPFIFNESKFGKFALAHNGTLVNFKEVKDDLIRNNALFQSTTDSEVLAHLIAQSKKDTIEEAIIEAMGRIQAAYSLLILTRDKLFAIRDRFGVRPLSLAQLDGGYLIASEDDAFDQFDAEHLRNVYPGEMIVFEKGKAGFRSIQYTEPLEMFCSFEGIYFSSPRATYHGYAHEDFRQESGKELFIENPWLTGDFILPILDSGKEPARGLAKKMGTELYKEYFMRRHNPKKIKKRSYTSPTFEERVRVARKKLHLRKNKIPGRHSIVVDDSIVRAITMKVVCQRLRQAGAAKITLVIASPPIRNICPMGMDHQRLDELIAYNRTVEEIQNEIGADKLIYLSLKGLKKVVARTYKCGICTGCFGGEYPVIPQ